METGSRRRTTLALRWALPAGLAALLLWVPLPFGSVMPWSHTVVQVTAFLLLALASLTAPRLAGLRPVLVPAACVAGVALFGAIQSSTVPPAIVRAISPEHARLQANAAALARSAGCERPVPSTLSLNPAASRTAALTWLAVAAGMLAAAAAATERRHRRLLGAAIVASGLFQVLFGARTLALAPGTIWGEKVGSDPSRLRGTFVNPDHLALYLELALPIAFVWGWWALRHARNEESIERRVALVAAPAIVWLTLFIGLAFTGSRGGLVGACVGAAAQGLLLAARRRRWRVGLAGVLLALVGIGAVAVVGLQQGLGRWLATSRYDLTWNDRLTVYGASWRLWEMFPLTGTGLATFRDAFTLVAPHAVTNAWYWHAHDDPLEVLVTTGLVGAALVLIGVVAAAGGLVRRLRADGRSEDRAAALAAIGALVAVVVHSLFDFGMVLPANDVTLAVMVAAGLAAGTARASRGTRAERPA